MHFNIGNGDENLILQLKWTYVRDKFDEAIKTKIETIYQLEHFYLCTLLRIILQTGDSSLQPNQNNHFSERFYEDL